MKKALIVVCLAALAFVLASCEDYETDPLEFKNASTYTVVVNSLSTEWDGFVLEPGEHWKKTGIESVDYTFAPNTRVKEGSASTDRYIVFVNIDANVTSW